MTEPWTVPVTPPFRYSQNLAYLQNSGEKTLFHIDPPHITTALRTEHGIAVVRLGPADNDNGLEASIQNDVDPQARAEITRRVREWFDLDTDLQPFYKMARHDPTLQHTVPRFHGLRHIGYPDLFEALCWAIIGQQINLAFAHKVKQRFVQAFGQAITHKGQTLWLFPTAEAVAHTTVADLQPLQLSRNKAEYIIGVAQHIEEGHLTKDALLQMEDADAIEKRLTALRGVGPWTANYVMMRCLRIASALPAADVGLQNALKQVLGRDTKPGTGEVRRLAAAWTGWESYATFYLWRLVQ